MKKIIFFTLASLLFSNTNCDAQNISLLKYQGTWKKTLRTEYVSSMETVDRIKIDSDLGVKWTFEYSLMDEMGMPLDKTVFEECTLDSAIIPNYSAHYLKDSLVVETIFD